MRVGLRAAHTSPVPTRGWHTKMAHTHTESFGTSGPESRLIGRQSVSPPRIRRSPRPRPDLGPTSADHWWTGDFQCRFGPSHPISPPRDRAHMTSDRALITGLVSRSHWSSSHSSSVFTFTLHVHPTGKLPESYLRIRQCPHHPKIPEN